jgi:hypothetical protein
MELQADAAAHTTSLACDDLGSGVLFAYSRTCGNYGRHATGRLPIYRWSSRPSCNNLGLTEPICTATVL